MKEISVADFKNVLDTRSAQVGIRYIDVRTREEYTEKHIDGVEHIPLSELEAHIETLKDATVIYAHCAAGGRSERAVRLLESHGVTSQLINVMGGILAWEAAGYPVLGHDTETSTKEN